MVSTVLAVAVYRWLPVPITPLMVIRCVQNIHNGETAAIHHKWVPLKQISPYLPVAVMASEDQNFMHHHGFDFNAIQDAAIERLEGKRSRGGSTISQQTAKNVFLWPQSSWLRKGFEVYFTVLIELMWPKERIMEVYLNSIEMGPNIYGAEAVAQRHFGCSARKLRRSDCALIAATLPNPLHHWYEKYVHHTDAHKFLRSFLYIHCRRYVTVCRSPEPFFLFSLLHVLSLVPGQE